MAARKPSSLAAGRAFVGRALLVIVAPLAVGCSGSDGTTTPPPTPTISVSATPATLALTQGQSGTVTVNLTRGGGYTGAVSLAVTGTPSGVTITPSVTSLTGSTLASTVTIAAGANAAAGPATLTITASGSGVTSQSATVALTVNAATQTLTVARAGSGSGTVTSSPAGIDCGATCAGSFPAGATVTLTAAPATGSAFAGWSGGCTNATGTCVVTLSAAQSVTATFNTVPTTQTLTVSTAGGGAGTVTSSPAGITCPGTCSASFAAGTQVTLTAAPSGGSTFTGWSGACTNATGTCTVTLSAAQTVTATFVPPPQTFALTVATTGTGTGTVTSAPAGITCPGTCSANFASGTSVTLTAAPAAGSTFGGWSGACTGTTPTCTVNVTAAATATASFSQVAQTFALTVATAGTGTGTVTSSPAGITCPGTCTNSYASGTAVTLTATPAAGSVFAGWTGACTNTTGTCAVTLSAAQSVTATFNTAPAAASFTLALSPAAVTVQAGGAAGSSTVNLTRTNFTDAIAITTSGAPNGLTVTPTPASVTGNSAALAVTAAATVAPGTYNVTVAGAGTGVTQQSATLAVTVTAAAPAGSFGLAIAPASVSVQQGATGTATVTVTRANGFAGAVDLAVSGAPNGLTITPNPASATGGTSTLNISAGATTTPGTYTITVTGTGTGVAQQTATFSVQVTQQSGGGGGGNVTFSFAGCDPTQVPIWLAVQNGNGAWTRVTPSANNTFSFTVGANGGVAYVTQSGTNFLTTVMYGVQGDLSTAGSRCGNTPTLGTKTLNGTVGGVGQTDFASVSIGSATKSIFGATAFTITNVPDGPRDLVATRASFDLTTGAQTLSKVIIRRNTNYPNNGTIPTLDFSSSEAFDPAQGTLTVNNLGGDQAFSSVAFITANGASAGFSTSLATGSTVPYSAVPASQLQASDIQQVTVIAAPPGNSPTSFREAFTYLRTAGNQTVTLGPSLAATTVTSLATTPYLRLHAQVQAQSAYNGLATASYTQTGRTVSVTQTAAYSGGAPANWTLDIPDLSAAGYDPNWGLHTGAQTSWSIIAVGGDFLAFIGGTPQNNTQVIAAAVTGSSSAFIQALRSRGITWMRRP